MGICSVQHYDQDRSHSLNTLKELRRVVKQPGEITMFEHCVGMSVIVVSGYSMTTHFLCKVLICVCQHNRTQCITKYASLYIIVWNPVVLRKSCILTYLAPYYVRCTELVNRSLNITVNFNIFEKLLSIFQVNVVHINAGSKNAADDKLRQCLRRFADSHSPNSKVILLSSEWLWLLKALKRLVILLYSFLNHFKT